MTIIKMKFLFPLAAIFILLVFSGCGDEGSPAADEETTTTGTTATTGTTPSAATLEELRNMFANVNQKATEARKLNATATDQLKAGETEAGNQTFIQARAVYDECIPLIQNILTMIDEIEKTDLKPVQKEYLDLKKGEANAALLLIQATSDIISIYLTDPGFANPESVQKFNSLTETVKTQNQLVKDFQVKAEELEGKSREEIGVQSGQ